MSHCRERVWVRRRRAHRSGEALDKPHDQRHRLLARRNDVDPRLSDGGGRLLASVRNRDFAEVLCAAGVVVGAAGGYAPASVGAIQRAIEAAWAAGKDQKGRRKIASKSETPFLERRDPDAAVGGCEGCAILEDKELPATIISYDMNEDPDAAQYLVRDIAKHFQTPGRSPGVLTCGHHVRLVVGAVNSPYEPPHIILLDPNWQEPKYEPRDQEWLERQDTTFELLLPVAVG